MTQIPISNLANVLCLTIEQCACTLQKEGFDGELHDTCVACIHLFDCFDILKVATVQVVAWRTSANALTGSCTLKYSLPALHLQFVNAFPKLTAQLQATLMFFIERLLYFIEWVFESLMLTSKVTDMDIICKILGNLNYAGELAKFCESEAVKSLENYRHQAFVSCVCRMLGYHYAGVAGTRRVAHVSDNVRLLPHLLEPLAGRLLVNEFIASTHYCLKGCVAEPSIIALSRSMQNLNAEFFYNNPAEAWNTFSYSGLCLLIAATFGVPVKSGTQLLPWLQENVILEALCQGFMVRMHIHTPYDFTVLYRCLSYTYIFTSLPESVTAGRFEKEFVTPVRLARLGFAKLDDMIRGNHCLSRMHLYRGAQLLHYIDAQVTMAIQPFSRRTDIVAQMVPQFFLLLEHAVRCTHRLSVHPTFEAAAKKIYANALEMSVRLLSNFKLLKPKSDLEDVQTLAGLTTTLRKRMYQIVVGLHHSPPSVNEMTQSLAAEAHDMMGHVSTIAMYGYERYLEDGNNKRSLPPELSHWALVLFSQLMPASVALGRAFYGLLRRAGQFTARGMDSRNAGMRLKLGCKCLRIIFDMVYKGLHIGLGATELQKNNATRLFEVIILSRPIKLLSQIIALEAGMKLEAIDEQLLPQPHALMCAANRLTDIILESKGDKDMLLVDFVSARFLTHMQAMVDGFYDSSWKRGPQQTIECTRPNAPYKEHMYMEGGLVVREVEGSAWKWWAHLEAIAVMLRSKLIMKVFPATTQAWFLKRHAANSLCRALSLTERGCLLSNSLLLSDFNLYEAVGSGDLYLKTSNPRIETVLNEADAAGDGGPKLPKRNRGSGPACFVVPLRSKEFAADKRFEDKLCSLVGTREVGMVLSELDLILINPPVGCTSLACANLDGDREAGLALFQCCKCKYATYCSPECAKFVQPSHYKYGCEFGLPGTCMDAGFVTIGPPGDRRTIRSVISFV